MGQQTKSCPPATFLHARLYVNPDRLLHSHAAARVFIQDLSLNGHAFQSPEVHLLQGQSDHFLLLCSCIFRKDTNYNCPISATIDRSANTITNFRTSISIQYYLCCCCCDIHTRGPCLQKGHNFHLHLLTVLVPQSKSLTINFSHVTIIRISTVMIWSLSKLPIYIFSRGQPQHFLLYNCCLSQPTDTTMRVN